MWMKYSETPKPSAPPAAKRSSALLQAQLAVLRRSIRQEHAMVEHQISVDICLKATKHASAAGRCRDRLVAGGRQWQA